MTITHDDVSQEPVVVHPQLGPESNGGFSGALTTGDHKVIGKMWIATSLIWGLVAVASAGIYSLERAMGTGSIDLDGIVHGIESFAQYGTFGKYGLGFLFAMPALVGLATYVTPLQIGANNVAFPRMANAAYWTWLISGVIMVISWAIDGGFVPGTDIDALYLSLASFGFVVLALIGALVVIATTVVTQRTKGMWLDRVPLYSWSMLVATGVWLLTLPVLLANVVLVFVDSMGDISGSFGNGAAIDIELGWYLDQPQVFALAIPVLGILADVMAAVLGGRSRGHIAAMGSIGLFGALTFGAYVQPFFNRNADTNPIYVLGTLGLLSPILVLFGAWGDMARQSEERGKALGAAAMAAGMAVISLLIAGGIAAVRVLHALLGPFADIEALQLSGTSAGHATYGAVLGTVLAALAAGLHYWSPKIYGRRLAAPMTSFAALCGLGATALVGFGELIAGFMDQPASAVAMVVAGEDMKSSVEIMDWIVFVGGVLLAFGVLVELINVLQASRKVGEVTDDDDHNNPWGATTLEWMTTSPPGLTNFTTPLTVTSTAPVLDAKSGADD